MKPDELRRIAALPIVGTSPEIEGGQAFVVLLRGPGSPIDRVAAVDAPATARLFAANGQHAAAEIIVAAAERALRMLAQSH